MINNFVCGAIGQAFFDQLNDLVDLVNNRVILYSTGRDFTSMTSDRVQTNPDISGSSWVVTDDFASANGLLGSTQSETLTIQVTPFSNQNSNCKRIHATLNTGISVPAGGISTQKDATLSAIFIAQNSVGLPVDSIARAVRETGDADDETEVGQIILDIVPDSNLQFTVDLEWLIGTNANGSTNVRIEFKEIGESFVSVV